MVYLSGVFACFAANCKVVDITFMKPTQRQALSLFTLYRN